MCYSYINYFFYILLLFLFLVFAYFKNMLYICRYHVKFYCVQVSLHCGWTTPKIIRYLGIRNNLTYVLFICILIYMCIHLFLVYEKSFFNFLKYNLFIMYILLLFTQTVFVYMLFYIYFCNLHLLNRVYLFTKLIQVMSTNLYYDNSLLIFSNYDCGQPHYLHFL